MTTMINGEQKTIVVGMSGGVDSSVAAALLKEQGHNVIGLFMKNWEELDEKGECQASKEFEDVASVCEKLGIPYYSVEFIEEYRENVFKHFIEEYKAGLTPNPDILCNREIKFKVFFEKAMQLGADFLATGHYCQNLKVAGKHRLVKGCDLDKDQTYFVYTMKEDILKRVLFPLGHLKKTQVREIAAQYNLITKDKKDSTGICFIGERNFKNFLSQYIQTQPGPFKTLDGTIVGEHSGSAYYTIGQRKGLGLGGQGEAWFVIDKITSENTVIVERGEQHSALYADELWANELSWVEGSFPYELPLRCWAKLRYRQQDQACTIQSLEKRGEESVLHVRFDEPQRAIALRQSIVFYLEKEGHGLCLGGGMVFKRGLSYYERGEVPNLSRVTATTIV